MSRALALPGQRRESILAPPTLQDSTPGSAFLAVRPAVWRNRWWVTPSRHLLGKEGTDVIGSLAHRSIDYIVGVALILAPFLFGFSDVASATWVAILVGAVVILYSLFTSYAAAMDRPVPFASHLTTDLIAGIFLAISPWLFGFFRFSLNVWLPHLLVGLAVVVVSLFSVRVAAGRTATAGQLGGEAPPEEDQRPLR
ncbi:MAG: SPW repeat protein [Armatimonadetes bacterium]|nr:SPW repeat protein [Armatimonadota bacterium]